MIRSAITVSLVPESRGGPFVFQDDLAAACQRASALGFDAVELFPPSANAVPLSVIRGLLESHALKLAAVGTGAGWVKHKLRLTDADPAVRARGREFGYSMINFAGMLGAPAIVGSMQGRAEEGQEGRDRALDWLAEALSALGERAFGHGVPLLYEPLNRYETNLFNTASAAAAFLDSRRIGNVKLLCDLFHMNLEEADIAASLREVAPRLAHVHWADSNRRAVGFGHTGIAPVAAALREIGYAGYLSAEVLPVPDAETAAKQTLASIHRWFP